MSANQQNSAMCVISAHSCVISSDSMDDEHTGLGLQLLCCRSDLHGMVEHRWQSLR